MASEIKNGPAGNSNNQDGKITRVLACFLSGYNGHPCAVSGHAIRTALRMKVPCSFGLFTVEKNLDSQREPRTYDELMAPRLNNYVPPFEMREVCAAKRQPFKIPVYYPVAVTFDMAGDQAGKLAVTGEFHLGGRRGTDHGRCKITDTAVIDTGKVEIPDNVEWVTLVTPRIATNHWPEGFMKRKVRLKKQLVIRFPNVTEYKVYPLGTIFKLEKGFAPDRYLARENKVPALGHGPLAELGFGEMHFWNKNQ